jgi:hypothetical protein
MQNPIHEAGETARTALDVFRTQPFLLAMILIDIALLGFLYYQGVNYNQERRRELELLYENRKIVTDALRNCYPAPPPTK